MKACNCKQIYDHGQNHGHEMFLGFNSCWIANVTFFVIFFLSKNQTNFAIARFKTPKSNRYLAKLRGETQTFVASTLCKP